MEDKDMIKRAGDLCSFLDKGVTPYHVVSYVENILHENGFKEFKYNESFGKFDRIKGFLKFHNSSIFAFDLDKKSINEGIKFISSHIDSPCLKIKSGSDIVNSSGEIYLNVEVYGGPILNTWFDRGLSIAGRVFVLGENFEIKEVLIDFEQEIAFIANCPIHLNREINSGFPINRQKHMLPIILTNSSFGNMSLKKMISTHFNLNEENILDFDLYLYDAQRAKIFGYNKEFIQSKKIDDLAMAESSIYSLINSKSSSNKFVCLFDGEEIGSSIKEGAHSNTLLNLLNRLYDSLELENENRQISLDNSFFISADMAHAYNSNYQEKFDEYNKCLINKGIVIKSNSNRSYMTTGETSSYIKALCKKNDIPYQVYHNRSDILGGSTLGPITNRYLSIRGVDIGNPMFAMHSCRETSGVIDHCNITKLFIEYFK